MIGSAALARYEGNVAKAFAAGSASCWSGYYHGILSHAFTDVELNELGPASRGLCDDEEIRRTDYLAYQCVHGLGHGLMIYTSYNLPLALETCDELATDWDQSSCSGGVFMENVTPSLGATTQWVKDDDPVYPCNFVAKRHKYYCYLMVTSRILALNGYDWEDTAATCRGVEKNWVSICFQSYGRDASGSTRQDPAEIVRLCGLAARWASDCIYGAARDVTSNDANATRSREVCEAADGSLKDVCYDGIGTILRGLSADAGEVRARARRRRPNTSRPVFAALGWRAEAAGQQVDARQTAPFAVWGEEGARVVHLGAPAVERRAELDEPQVAHEAAVEAPEPVQADHPRRPGPRPRSRSMRVTAASEGTARSRSRSHSREIRTRTPALRAASPWRTSSAGA